MRWRWFFTITFLLLLSVASLQCQVAPSNVPLIQAIWQGNLDEARKVLRAGTKLNVSDNNGDTPLGVAIRKGYTDFAEELLSAGADPKFAGPSGDTALMGAAWQNNLGLARELLDRGASVNAANAKGVTALMHASYTCLDGKMVQLLVDAGADPNAQTSDGLTPIMHAAYGGNASAAEILIKAGADVTAKDKHGHTAEVEACGSGEKGHAKVCDLLRKTLAKRGGRGPDRRGRRREIMNASGRKFIALPATTPPTHHTSHDLPSLGISREERTGLEPGPQVAEDPSLSHEPGQRDFVVLFRTNFGAI